MKKSFKNALVIGRISDGENQHVVFHNLTLKEAKRKFIRAMYRENDIKRNEADCYIDYTVGSNSKLEIESP